MRCSLGGLVVVLFLLLGLRQVQANDFSSFLSANASLAVVVDHEYMQQRGEHIIANFQKILSDTIRENLKNGGINVKYFSWSAVRLKKDFFAAITVTDCKNTWRFYESLQISSILQIAFTDGDCPRLPIDRALMIPFVGRGEEFSQMILDSKVQNILKWNTGVMLIDQTALISNPLLVASVVHENARHHIRPISLLLHNIDDRLRSLEKRRAIRQILAPYAHKPQEHQQFMVFSKFYEDIIEVAQSLNMFHIYNQWLFFVLDEGKDRTFDAPAITQSLGEGVNIAFVLNETQTNCRESLNCTIAEVSIAFVTSISRLILEEQSIYGEISDEEWESIRFTKQEKQDEILSYMKDYLKLNSKCSSCSRWRVKTANSWVFRETPDKQFDFIDIGYWSPLLGFETHELIFPHVEHYFRNISVDILTLHNPPWQILKRNSKGVIVEHSGITMEILKELSRMLNFTYQLHEAKNSEDDEFGMSGYNETDNLSGSLTYLLPYRVVEAVVQDNRFLFAAVAASIDEPDQKPFNYSIPISVQKYSFISRRPDEISRIYLFTAPFTLETWACLVAVLIITAPILYLINRLAPLEHLRIDGLCSIRNCFWYIYGALLQQGGMYLPRADSGRLVVGIWWIVVIVLVTTYCGNLVAFLTFPKFQPGLDYLFHLFKENEINQFGLRNGTLFEKYAKISDREEYRQFLQYAVIYNNVEGENMAAVESGRRVNIDWRINLQLIIQNHFEREKECKFILAKENFLEEQIALILPIGSPYLYLINEQIRSLFYMGFIERWHQTNLPSMDKCSGRGVLRQITNHKVNLDDMQGCFLVLLLGFMVAVFVIFIEFWYHRLYVGEKSKGRGEFST